MIFRTPDFWYGNPDAAATAKAAALSAISALYLIGHSLHQAMARRHRAPVTVITLGNIVAGGSGKTPAALALMALVREEGLAKNPCFLTRGYGGRESGPLLVDIAAHGFRDVGDEALLLAAAAPTVICVNRLEGARYAAAQGFDLVLMDDGLQNTTLRPDLAFLVVDGTVGFGNGLLLPAGPLRTPLHKGVALCDAALLVGEDRRNVLQKFPEDKLVVRAHITVAKPENPAPAYFAFSGIARPEKFFDSLNDCGLNVAGTERFPDHHAFTQGDIARLRKKAGNSRLITTAKDAVRLTKDFIEPGNFDILSIRMNFAHSARHSLVELIKNAKTAR